MTNEETTETARIPFRPFIVRTKPGEYLHAPEIHIRYADRLKSAGSFGGMQSFELDGKNLSRLEIYTARVNPESAAAMKDFVPAVTGTGKPGSMKTRIDRNSKALEQHVRRLAPADVTTIDEIDSKILDVEDQIAALVAPLKAKIRDLKVDRKNALDSSWRRARKLRLDEVNPTDDEPIRKIRT